jgi:hypothetical protein
MAVRTTETTVTFKNAFHFADAEDALPPGTYQLIVDDEELPGMTFMSYRRVATMLLVPRLGAPQEQRRTTLYLSQTELDAALMKDAGAAL